jgi:hypothetical protein
MDALLFVLGLCLLTWRAIAAVQVGLDAHKRGLAPLTSAGHALIGVVHTQWYWWGARLKLMSDHEAQSLLHATAQTHRLQNVVNVRCPLCDAEIAHALTLDADGALSIRPNARCPNCEFRLDACRHCAHFLPAQTGFSLMGGYGDFSHGRCGQYRALQSVRDAYPMHARRMEAMGYDRLPAPRPIVDSFYPLDECTAFTFQAERLRSSKISWLDRQRIAVIRLYQKLNSS